ncbi:MAG: hypothetical protein HW412_933 [Bacteroidetes bacterium]|nr:hypothetical protein [Bacteroidota bacterium]
MLNQKVSVITGASSGIGAALAALLAKEGSIVVICARRQHLLEEVANSIARGGGICRALQCDVTKPDDAEKLIQQTIEEFGRIDILVNNAGRGHFASVEDTTDEMLHSMFAVNVFSLWYTTRPAIRHMKKQGSGHIINVASMAGKLGFPYNSAYVAAKHACVGFTRALRLELVETNIHASVVLPGGVRTDWASVTEGGSMLSMFSEAGPIIKRIAAERGLVLPPIEGVKSAEDVANKILECIYHPVAEVFTHKGSQEFAVYAAEKLEEAEQQQIPVVLGEREVYNRIKGSKDEK